MESQSICLKGFKSGGSLVGNECKTRNHYASHNDYSLWSTPSGVATFPPPSAAGFSFNK